MASLERSVEGLHTNDGAWLIFLLFISVWVNGKTLQNPWQYFYRSKPLKYCHFPFVYCVLIAAKFGDANVCSGFNRYMTF